jgi:hypothetical protein
VTPDDPRHGTLAGYIYHRNASTPYCAACRRAAADYERQRNYDKRLGRPRLIPVTGTVRRIRALQRLGWSMAEIARQGGWKDRDSIYNTLLGDHITAKNAARVAEVYERLCMTIGPSTITAARATRAGWPPPLAWDDIDNDPEPSLGDHDDDIDPVVVMRLLEGQRINATKGEKEAALERWVADGGSERELCAWHGWKPGRYSAGLRIVRGGAA